MFVIGLTGGIASGKSEVSKILSGLGALVIDADIVAREVTKKGTSTWNRLWDEFGPKYFLPGGEIIRKKLGELVFSNKEALGRLNSITHGAIKKRIEDELANLRRSDGNKVVVIDAALLLEAGWQTMVNEVWVVDAPLDQRLVRLMDRNNLTKEEALRRIKSQMSQEERRKGADRVIYNGTGLEDLKRAIRVLWDETLEGQSPDI